jgi:hypothetical protein
MDRTKQAKHLREVEGLIAKSKRHIARQQEMITELEGDGHDTTPALRLLETLENTRRLHLYTRETIRHELNWVD